MEKNIRTSDKVFKALTRVMIVLFVIAVALWQFNSYLDKQEINGVINAVEEAFGYSTEYVKGSNNIKLNFTIKGKKELLETSKRALPKLTDLSDNIIDTLVVNAKFPDGDFQSFYIRFENIGKIDWNKINDIDNLIDILSELS